MSKLHYISFLEECRGGQIKMGGSGILSKERRYRSEKCESCENQKERI